MSDESDLKALGEFFKAKKLTFSRKKIEYFSENQINGKTTEFQKLKKY